MTPLVAVALVVLASAAPTGAQSLIPDAEITTKWRAAIESAARSHGARLESGTLRASDSDREAIYRDAIVRLLNERFRDAATTDESIVRQTVRASDRIWVDRMRQSGAESRAPKETDARSTNPVTQGVTERSGFTELLALALNGQNVMSADATAISLNLNALALVSLADPDVYSELFRYQQHDFARRFGGTITLGSKIPEKEITGLSNLPNFDTLTDAVAWDVKFRVLGDKDPRSRRWFPLTIGRGGDLNQTAAVALADVPVADAALVRRLFDDAVGLWLTDLKRRVARSAQFTVKFSGTHLKNDAGKNKYTAAGLFDVGAGSTDVTANITYAVTNDVSLGVDQLFAVKRLDVSAQLTSHLAQGAFVSGRSVDLSVGASGTFFTDKAAMPVAVKDTWRIFSTFDVPLGKAAKVPFSIIYSNDPNALEKSKYVSGFVGLSYDFSALGQLFGSN